MIIVSGAVSAKKTAKLDVSSLSGSVSTAYSSPYTTSFNFTNNGDYVILAVHTYLSNTPTVSATYGGRSMSPLANAVYGNLRINILGLSSAPAGTNAVNPSVSWSSGTGNVAMRMLSFTSASTATPVGTNQGASASNPSVTVSSTSDRGLVAAFISWAAANYNFRRSSDALYGALNLYEGVKGNALGAGGWWATGTGTAVTASGVVGNVTYNGFDYGWQSGTANYAAVAVSLAP